VAHNHKVAGSSPAPATKERVRLMTGFFFGSELVSSLRQIFCKAKYLSRTVRRSSERKRELAHVPFAAKKGKARCPASATKHSNIFINAVFFVVFDMIETKP
jgi:hypothetical protein